MKLETRGENWVRLDRVDSTNSYILAQGGDFDSGTVVLAREQNAGRGRGGRTWLARPGDAFIFSGLLRLRRQLLPAGRMLLVPLLCGIAVLRGAQAALTRYAPARPTDVFSIKWPNDVYMTGPKGPGVEGGGEGDAVFGKLAGVLVETDVRGDDMRFVLGVGLNWRGLPDPAGEYRVPPAALFAQAEQDASGEEFAAFFIAAFNERVEQLLRPEAPAFMSEIRENFYLMNRLIRLNERTWRVEDFLNDGGLVLRDVESGEKNLVYDAPDHMQVL